MPAPRSSPRSRRRCSSARRGCRTRCGSTRRRRSTAPARAARGSGRASAAVLARARWCCPWGEQARMALPVSAPSVTLPVPVEEIGPGPERDIDVLAYAGYPRQARAGHPLPGLDRGRAPRRAAADRRRGARRGRWTGSSGAERPSPPGVEWIGALPRDQWLHRVARARVFVERLALGGLRAVAARGAVGRLRRSSRCRRRAPYEALPLARELAPELVAIDSSPSELARSLRAGLDLHSRAEYAARAAGAAAAVPRGRGGPRAVASGCCPSWGCDERSARARACTTATACSGARSARWTCTWRRWRRRASSTAR